MNPYQDQRLPPRRVQALIARVVMVGADMDMVMSLYLCSLTGGDVRTELARKSALPFGRKTQAVKDRLLEEGEPKASTVESLFSEIHRFIRLRNTVSHGRYCGRGREGHVDVYSFLNPHEPEESILHAETLAKARPDAPAMIIQNTSEKMLEDAVRNGASMTACLKETLGVLYLHERYDSHVLSPGDVLPTGG